MPGTRSAGRHGGLAVHNPTFWTSRTSRWPSRTSHFGRPEPQIWTSRTSPFGRPEPQILDVQNPTFWTSRTSHWTSRTSTWTSRTSRWPSRTPFWPSKNPPLWPSSISGCWASRTRGSGQIPDFCQGCAWENASAASSWRDWGGDSEIKTHKAFKLFCYRPRRRFLNVLAWRSTLYDDWHPCVLTDDAVQAVDWLLSQSSAGGGPATTSVRAILPRGCRDSRRCCTTCSATVTLENRNLL